MPRCSVPELPEVETVVRDLRPRLRGRRIEAVRAGARSLRRAWRSEWETHLVGRQVRAVERRGKWIVILLDDGQCLVYHLGMTGQLTVVADDAPEADHVHLVLDLDAGRRLRFRDIRRFGSATLFDDRPAVDAFFAQCKLGPEPFTLDPKTWHRQLAKTRRSLKAVLLDQRVVAGVGNIYADESLFEAHLPPTLTGRATTATQAERLRKAIATVLTRAIERRGSSIRNYVGGSGLRGGYQEEFRVYGRAGQPCRRCETPIRRIRLAGRSTYFCPKCQAGRGQGSGVRGQKRTPDP